MQLQLKVSPRVWVDSTKEPDLEDRGEKEEARTE